MVESLCLKNSRVALGPERAEKFGLHVARGRILPFGTHLAGSDAAEIDLSGHLLLPGLVNAHDHLEFNLFPRLGTGPWPNAQAWAAAVHRPDRHPVKEHRAVPRRVRLIWGGIKNLLSGVTTVAHHNPWETVFEKDFPVRVVRRYGWAHSLHFSPDIAERFRDTLQDWPFIVHAAEGTDACAQAEVSQLDQLGILTERTVLVHAIGATTQQRDLIAERGASIVWCPTSNLFTMGATLPRQVVSATRRLALGTDSALTAEGDMIDEIRAAREHGLTLRDIYPIVTTRAAEILRLKEGEGEIREGGVADLIAVRDSGQTPAEALLDLRPQLVMVGGRVMLLSSALAANLGSHGLQPVEIEGRGTWLVRSDVPQLYSTAACILSDPLRLAGRRVSL